jgi:predicted enzyme related to lactoylglutathione lyase
MAEGGVAQKSVKDMNMGTRFTHTNLIARNWKRLSKFYQEVFECVLVPPERNLSGEWVDRMTGIPGAEISGAHLRLPGCGEEGPTLEIFQYGTMPDHPAGHPNTPGFSHIAFAVDDVERTAQTAFDQGASPVGELVVKDVPGVGILTVHYVRDPEGNIVEIQKWEMTQD